VLHSGDFPLRILPGYSLHVAKKTRTVKLTVPEEVAATLEHWTETGVIESPSQFVADAVARRSSREESLTRWEQAIGGHPLAELIDRVRASHGLPPRTNDSAA